ncbi:2-C-methyl-D-erythritol 4-phosphate cytidylyltransferase [Bacillus pseudomycoides]|nr:2-C-methyl-D-erythritol 4-phosphate cytidylyltransferase [Bacillus pseudomycoides]PEE03804.1 2-C-methyl-D-erythritol 4-phosphate cytidylyltransferase [Bacillus pseudomycoides]PEK80453.1 2-C-methyl-D-erythritol 4-phosphate cytidylyltransferase [Bacillus pseudomycoides]PEM75937.1 2-C-methyl-D-erythritol 4-phosphate cytidylyltransferase [Bacillus pseudomycoides]PEN05387.1 2-C-methyl-D-erythritol 4-phosphate cytidylyltransferase [Bacillus pseudomycoides]
MRFEISFISPTRSPPYTGVFTLHFTCVYCISKILLSLFSLKSFFLIFP